MEYHLAENKDTGMSKRTVERIVTRVVDKAGILKLVSPDILSRICLVKCIKKVSPPVASNPVYVATHSQSLSFDLIYPQRTLLESF